MIDSPAPETKSTSGAGITPKTSSILELAALLRRADLVVPGLYALLRD